MKYAIIFHQAIFTSKTQSPQTHDLFSTQSQLNKAYDRIEQKLTYAVFYLDHVSFK